MLFFFELHGSRWGWKRERSNRRDRTASGGRWSVPGIFFLRCFAANVTTEMPVGVVVCCFALHDVVVLLEPQNTPF